MFTLINKISDNETIQSFYNMIPYFKYYIDSELAFTISNTERFLLVKDSENLKVSAKTGDKIPNGCAADVCLKRKKKISIVVPREVFGMSAALSNSIDQISKSLTDMSSGFQKLYETNSNIRKFVQRIILQKLMMY